MSLRWRSPGFAVSGDAVCGVRESDGQVQCWGNDSYLQVSWAFIEQLRGAGGADCQGRTTASVRCSRMTERSSAGVWAATSGSSGSQRSRTLPGPYVAIRSDGTLYCGQRDTGAWECFGWDDYGETQVPVGETFVELGPGGNHSCGIRLDGTVLCFGAAAVNEDASADFGQTRPPSEVDDVFIAVASGSWTTCGIRIDGRFECWGRYTDNDPQGMQSVARAAGGGGGGGGGAAMGCATYRKCVTTAARSAAMGVAPTARATRAAAMGSSTPASSVMTASRCTGTSAMRPATRARCVRRAG